ncbi:DUF3604 domain-containing protein [Coraliomargarita akajimensis]|uniref:DUF3604 domain-containing protein n=1 Tax=Coraliomargarita akajimensis (strain DSM 45221 / IAM 15411 / JCM 23193 / KCTC 12865 / 04OKA010-24) TaxID=583355 RepID=D5EKE8_CORAD|nr:DUF3604 domain-containing protein [Coraliomargarita akajimensis]ADE54897.1 conserved hypothetical protein [Coraliomargarita akajimensis DSM 45221]
MKPFHLALTCTSLSLIASAQTSAAHVCGTPVDPENLYPGKGYSPYAQRSFPDQVYWGDTHLHTGLSLDAGLFGNTVGLDDAYKFAKGEEVRSSTGLRVRLARPLDWLVVTDHTDLMGMATDLQAGAPAIMASEKGREWNAAFNKGGTAAGEAAFDLITNFSQMTLPEELLKAYSPGSDVFAGVWEQIVDAAEEHNEPGNFTAFIGFEWTSVPKGFNLHRNVILRDGGERAKRMQPPTTQPPLGGTDPLFLYQWLEEYEAKTGGRAMSLAHNGNLSNGWMFPTEKRYGGGVVDEEYVRLRAKWEPQYEITQIKGDGEAHPYLSPEDPFADYENWDVGNLDLTELKKPEMLKGEYAREALKQGLKLEAKFGINPYKFGFGGATDSHTSLATAEEENFFGKAVSAEPSATRVNHPFIKSKLGEIPGDLIVASGYTGIWANENTRAALFDAMMRRETYGTTGPRMTVRFFGGWDFNDNDLRSRAPAFRGYEKGVPMGGDLRTRSSDGAPTFMVYALRDSRGANLDRIQIVKGWLDTDGELHERVYDVVVSDGRAIDAEGICTTPVGNTVDLEAANWTNTIGASELATIWTDPDFDAAESAFYYARVLEIPTPRWIVYDKLRLGAELPENAQLTGQERAYTSPIWYSPEK